AISTEPGGLGPVTIGGDVRGGAGFQSGAILGAGQFAGVTVHGSLLGGNGDFSGQIVQGDSAQAPRPALAQLSKQSVGSGRLHVGGYTKGGHGSTPAAVLGAGALPAVGVDGALLGGLGDRSGQIISSGGLGQVTVKGNVRGGDGFQSGAIVSAGAIAAV